MAIIVMPGESRDETSTAVISHPWRQAVVFVPAAAFAFRAPNVPLVSNVPEALLI